MVISDEEIDYPKAIRPDVFLAMNQKSLDAFIADGDHKTRTSDKSICIANWTGRSYTALFVHHE